MAYEGQDKINYEQGNWYLPQLKYSLPYDTPTTEEDQLGSATGAGIPYTGAFTGGGSEFNPGGNAFGYGTAIDPITTSGTGEQIVANKALADMNIPNLHKTEIGPSYEGYNEDMLPAAGQETVPESALNDVYQYIKKDPAKYNKMSNEEVYAEMRGDKGGTTAPISFLKNPLAWTGQKVRSAFGMLPEGVQKTAPGAGIGTLASMFGMPWPISLGIGAAQMFGKGEGYRVGGMDAAQKGAYNTLAAQGMLFEGSTGLKTLTGKNFMGSGYMEGQLELAKKFGFDEMTDEEIDAAIEAEKTRRSESKTSSGFKWKQMKEAKEMSNYDKVITKNKEEAQLAAAQQEIDREGYKEHGQGAASQETQRSYEDAGGSYTGAGEDPDWGGGEKEGGFIDGSNRRVGFKYGGIATAL
jgi:hypothetical protein